MSAWIQRLYEGVPDGERAAVDRYADRLIQFARRQLPGRFQRRLDPEDIVQSVYRSFFGRLRRGEFAFEDSHDLWRLLIVMTYHKINNTIKHHLRGRRDLRRETAPPAAIWRSAVQDREPGPDDVVQLCDLLETMLAGLPADYRRMVVLRLEGFSLDEIAAQVTYSRRTVMRVLSRVQDSALKQMEP